MRSKQNLRSTLCCNFDRNGLHACMHEDLLVCIGYNIKRIFLADRINGPADVTQFCPHAMLLALSPPLFMPMHK